MKTLGFVIGALIAVGFQTWSLGDMIWDRAQLIRNGQEVRLATGFIDPRDIFRGHYVSLDLLIEEVTLPDDQVDDDLPRRETVYAVLTPGEDGFATIESVHATLPDTDKPVIAGNFWYQSDRDGDKTEVNIRFPIDRYYAPKLEALRLENLRNEDRLGIVVALSDTGAAAIKGIIVDGEVIYDEPLF